MVRVEVSLPEGDRELIREVAERLREPQESSDQFRRALWMFLNGVEEMDFKEFLMLAPLEGLDLERDRDSGMRDIDW